MTDLYIMIYIMSSKYINNQYIMFNYLNKSSINNQIGSPELDVATVMSFLVSPPCSSS